MDTLDSPSLFSAIDAFLCADAGRRSALAFWATRPVITRGEMGVLNALADEPLPPDTLAPMLGREPCAAKQLLDGMVAVGILERRGELYAASECTILYCREFLPHAAGHDR